VVGVEELLDAVVEDGDGDEAARDDGEDACAALVLRREADGEPQRASAEGQFAEHERGGEAVGGLMGPGRRVHQRDERKNRSASRLAASRVWMPVTRLKAAADEAGSDEVRPEHVPRDPGGDDRGDDAREHEVLGAKAAMGTA